jgi:hypothetical protein
VLLLALRAKTHLASQYVFFIRQYIIRWIVAYIAVHWNQVKRRLQYRHGRYAAGQGVKKYFSLTYA